MQNHLHGTTLGRIFYEKIWNKTIKPESLDKSLSKLKINYYNNQIIQNDVVIKKFQIDKLIIIMIALAIVTMTSLQTHCTLVISKCY